MTWSAPSALALSALASSPTVVKTVAPAARAIWIAAVPMPEPPACTSTLSPASSLALSNNMCCTVANAIGAQAASRKATPGGTGMVSRAGMLTRSRAKPSTWKPMTPPTFSHRLSRPSRQALQTPQVSAPYITTGLPGLKAVTSAPTAAISPAASAPTTSGSWRLAKAMPRQPQTSMWLSATALTRICTSPAPGGGGGAASTHSSLRLARRVSARMRPSHRFAAQHQRDVLAAETEGVGERVTYLGVARHVGDDVERDRRIRDLVVDGRRQALMLQRQQREHRLDGARRRQCVADHRLVRGDRDRLGTLAEHARNAEALHLVVLGRAGAGRIDVVDVVGREAGVGDVVADAADDRLAVGTRAGAVERVRHLAATFEDAQDGRAACLGVIEAFEHERGGAFRHHEAVAVLGERL